MKENTMEGTKDEGRKQVKKNAHTQNQNTKGQNVNGFHSDGTKRNAHFRQMPDFWRAIDLQTRQGDTFYRDKSKRCLRTKQNTTFSFQHGGKALWK